MATIEELAARAAEIRNETEQGRNTADRVGSLLHDIIGLLSTKQAELGYAAENVGNKIKSTDPEPDAYTDDQYLSAAIMATFINGVTTAIQNLAEGKVNYADIQQALTTDTEKVPSSALLKATADTIPWSGSTIVTTADTDIQIQSFQKNTACRVRVADSGVDTYNLYFNQGFYMVDVVLILDNAKLTPTTFNIKPAPNRNISIPIDLQSGITVPAGGTATIRYMYVFSTNTTHIVSFTNSPATTAG
jgi:hypothetical protein